MNTQYKKAFLNEKNLIIGLLLTTVLSLCFILRNLPSHANFVSNNNEDFNRFFFPRTNKIKNDSILPTAHNHKHHRLKSFLNLPIRFDQSNHESIKESKALDPVNIERREKVKQMTLFAWNGYKKYAWGKNELKPLSKRSHLAGIFGNADNLGATIVDSLDTLYIMGFMEEFNLGREWIKNEFNIMVDTELSAFEINIRYIGGFLSLYTLTKEKLFLNKAIETADAIMPIFNTTSGLPLALINPKTKRCQNYKWASSSCSILGEIGTFSLEFQYLSDLTGNNIYEQKINKIHEFLVNTNKPEGLYYNYINPKTGNWCGTNSGIGGLADSFYEYLLKLWLYKDKSNKKLFDSYLNALNGVKNKLISRSTNGFLYTGEYTNHLLLHKMGHLACYTGGLFALTSMYVTDLDDKQRTEFEDLSKDITNTCHESYIINPTHLGGESFTFESGIGPKTNERYYILRPEVIESYFYLWRMTKDQKYRDWAWDVVEALEKYCKTANGYSGIKDVTSNNPVKDDVQQSFFFAETLKYLYLIFSDDDVIPLNQFVFNTEAHPFPIRSNQPKNF